MGSHCPTIPQARPRKRLRISKDPVNAEWKQHTTDVRRTLFAAPSDKPWADAGGLVHGLVPLPAVPRMHDSIEICLLRKTRDVQQKARSLRAIGIP